MLLYKGKTYQHYYDLLVDLIINNKPVNEHIFPSSRIYFCKIALENKFNRRFTIKEVKRLIKDISNNSSKNFISIKRFKRI
jgi:hypothetical protein